MKIKVIYSHYDNELDEVEYNLKEVSAKVFPLDKDVYVVHLNRKWYLVDSHTGMHIITRNFYSQLEHDWKNCYQVLYHNHQMKDIYKIQCNRYERLLELGSFKEAKKK